MHEKVLNIIIHSVQFSCSVVSNSLQPYGLQHARLPCHHQLPEFTKTHVHWVGDAIQLSHPLSSPSPLAFNPFPASGSFQMSQFFTLGSQSTGVSASASVLPMNIQDWFPSGWTDWISLLSKWFLGVFPNITVRNHQFFGAQVLIVQLSHPYMTTGKTIALTRWTFVGKVMSLLFNMLTRLAYELGCS